MVDIRISRAKVMLFDETNNILTEKITKNFQKTDTEPFAKIDLSKGRF